MRDKDQTVTLEGTNRGAGLKFAVVVARFNEFVTERLEAGALEALAAGETPSPEMVAASGPAHLLNRRLATGLLAAIAVSLVTVFWLTGRSQMLNQLPLEYPPEVLAERAREIVRAAGYKERAADSAFGFESDSRYVRYFDDTLAGSQRDRRETWTSLLSRSPSPLTFWYIHSASPLVPLTSGLATLGRVERDQPLIQLATVLVELDPDGRLRRFVATRMDRDTASDSAASVDWSALFSTAGLDFSRFTPGVTSTSTSERRAMPSWVRSASLNDTAESAARSGSKSASESASTNSSAKWFRCERKALTKERSRPSMSREPSAASSPPRPSPRGDRRPRRPRRAG